jgi:hypothetical protein
MALDVKTFATKRITMHVFLLRAGFLSMSESPGKGYTVEDAKENLQILR